MQLEVLKKIVVGALEEVKAQDIRVLDVRNVASFTDLMVIASGSSTRQVKALADLPSLPLSLGVTVAFAVGTFLLGTWVVTRRSARDAV